MAIGQIFIGRVNMNRSDSINIRCDRKTPLGNPYWMRDESHRKDVCNRFKLYLPDAYKYNLQLRDKINEIIFLVRAGQDVNLQCWCAPKQCHTESIRDFVLELINGK